MGVHFILVFTCREVGDWCNVYLQRSGASATPTTSLLAEELVLGEMTMHVSWNGVNSAINDASGIKGPLRIGVRGLPTIWEKFSRLGSPTTSLLAEELVLGGMTMHVSWNGLK